MHRVCAAAAAALVVCLLRSDGGAQPSHETLLGTHFGFSADDVRRVERGEAVAVSLPGDGAEVALAASAILRIPLAFYLERFRVIETFKRSAEVQQIGRFSVPPSAADLRPLTLDPGDIGALRACRPGGCDVKLDAAGIERARGAADVEGILREHLAAYAARYLREGNAALMEYHDRQTPQRIAGELRLILERSPYLKQHWPALAAAAGSFTGSLPDPLQHFLYWSKEKPAAKPVVSLTHAIVQPPAGGTAAVVTKQIYASHYMTGSLGLTVLVERGTAESPRTQLIYVNRTRLDVFDGVLGKLKRPLVRSRARSGAEQMLTGLRTRLESEFRAASR